MHKLGNFLTHGEWVMSILTLAYVVISFFYVLISRRTLYAVKRQADNLDRTLKLQEAGMRQWVEVSRWHIRENPDHRKILTLYFEIVNRTSAPLTLDAVFITVMGGQQSDTNVGSLLIPNRPSIHDLPVQLSAEQVDEYVDDRLVVTLECKVFFTDALDIKWQQFFGRILDCKITEQPSVTETKNVIQHIV